MRQGTDTILSPLVAAHQGFKFPSIEKQFGGAGGTEMPSEQSTVNASVRT